MFFGYFFTYLFYFPKKNQKDQTITGDSGLIVERTSIFGDRIVPSTDSPKIFDSIPT